MTAAAAARWRLSNRRRRVRAGGGRACKSVRRGEEKREKTKKNKRGKKCNLFFFLLFPRSFRRLYAQWCTSRARPCVFARVRVRRVHCLRFCDRPRRRTSPPAIVVLHPPNRFTVRGHARTRDASTRHRGFSLQAAAAASRSFRRIVPNCRPTVRRRRRRFGSRPKGVPRSI